MKIKKILAGISIICICMASACGNAAPSPKASEISEQILNEIEFNSASEKSVSDLEYYIPSLDAEAIDELSYYICGSGAYPDELLIVKFKSKAEAETALPIVKSRLNSQSEIFSDYAPAEMYKLETAVIKVKNNYLFFYVLSDNDKANEITDKFFK